MFQIYFATNKDKCMPTNFLIRICTCMSWCPRSCHWSHHWAPRSSLHPSRRSGRASPCYRGPWRFWQIPRWRNPSRPGSASQSHHSRPKLPGCILNKDNIYILIYINEILISVPSDQVKVKFNNYRKYLIFMYKKIQKNFWMRNCR